jgi:hypothetical protein
MPQRQRGRDGHEGWTRRYEDAYERAFGARQEPKGEAELEAWFAAKTEVRTSLGAAMCAAKDGETCEMRRAREYGVDIDLPEGGTA